MYISYNVVFNFIFHFEIILDLRNFVKIVGKMPKYPSPSSSKC